jgi:hypothetical protein
LPKYYIGRSKSSPSKLLAIKKFPFFSNQENVFEEEETMKAAKNESQI